MSGQSREQRLFGDKGISPGLGYWSRSEVPRFQLYRPNPECVGCRIGIMADINTNDRIKEDMDFPVGTVAYYIEEHAKIVESQAKWKLSLNRSQKGKGRLVRPLAERERRRKKANYGESKLTRRRSLSAPILAAQ